MFASDYAKYAIYYACVRNAHRHNDGPSLRLALNFKLTVHVNRATMASFRLFGPGQLVLYGMPVWYKPSSWLYYRVA
jgi:hypothetical protein